MKIQLNNRNNSRRFRPGMLGASIAIFALGALGEPAQAALLVNYNFNAGSGTAVANSGTLGSAADAALLGSTTWSGNTPSGSGFSAYAPGGANDGIGTAAVVSALNGLSQISGTLWVNLQATPAANDRLLSNASSNNGFEFNILSGTSASNYTVGVTIDGFPGSSSSAISQSGWTFLAFTYDGTISDGVGTLKIYVGSTTSMVTQAGSTKNLDGDALGTSTNPFLVGNTSLTTSDRTPNALFDNVQIYDTVLDSTQLEAVRMAAIPEPPAWTAMAVAGTMLVLIRRRNRH